MNSNTNKIITIHTKEWMICVLLITLSIPLSGCGLENLLEQTKNITSDCVSGGLELKVNTNMKFNDSDSNLPTQEQITTSNVGFTTFGFPTPTLPFNKPERNVVSGTVAGNILRTCNLRELVDVKNIELFTCQDTNGFRCSVYLETKKD